MIQGGDDDLVFTDSDDDTLLPLQQLQKFSHFLQMPGYTQQALHGYTWPPSPSPSPSPSSPPSPPIFIKIFHFPLVQARYAIFCEYLRLSFCIFLRICVLRLRGSAVTLGGAPRGLCCLCICITATHYFSFPNINICVQISPLPASELLMGLWAPLKCILAALIQDTLLLLGCST